MADVPDSLPGEIWKPVAGYEGAYEISSMGRLKRVAGYRYAGPGRTAKITERVWLGAKSDTGYYRASLGRHGRKVYVHQLVCEAFHGPAPNGKRQVAHYDGDKLNNRASNLRWADWKDNRSDGIRLGEVKRGEARHNSKLTLEQVADIRRLHTSGMAMRAIGRTYGICHQHVGDIVRRKTWKD